MKGRLEFVNDLCAEDAIYHGDCNSRFRSGKWKPGVEIANSSRKCERPTINEREEAFEEIVEYVRMMTNRLLSVN